MRPFFSGEPSPPPSSSLMFFICCCRKYSFCCSSRSSRVLSLMLFLMSKSDISLLSVRSVVYILSSREFSSSMLIFSFTLNVMLAQMKFTSTTSLLMFFSAKRDSSGMSSFFFMYSAVV